MVGGAEHAAEHFQHAFFDFGAGVVLTPGMPHQLGRAFAIALRQQGARKHIAALGGGGLLLREECTHRAIVDAVVPQRILSAAAKQRRVRPARICSDEGRVTLERRIGIVGTQDHPFGKLACDGIADARLGGIGLGFLALAGSLDHAFHRSNVGFRSCCRRRDREGAGGRPRERFEDGARLGDRAAQPDIGLRERCEARFFVLLVALAAASAGAGWPKERPVSRAACLTTWIAGRGRGKGTFCASAVAVWADSTDAAVNVKQMPKRLRLVAFIQPR